MPRYMSWRKNTSHSPCAFRGCMICSLDGASSPRDGGGHGQLLRYYPFLVLLVCCVLMKEIVYPGRELSLLHAYDYVTGRAQGLG